VAVGCVVQFDAKLDAVLLESDQAELVAANCDCAAVLAKMFRKESALSSTAEAIALAGTLLSGVAAVQATLGTAEDEITRYRSARQWPNPLELRIAPLSVR